MMISGTLMTGGNMMTSGANLRSSGGLRPRSPSHAAKNKTPEDRVCEFGWMLTQKEGRLMCRACNLNLDHTRRSTIVEHLRSRKHQRFLEECDLDLDLGHADAAAVAPIVLMEICEDESSQNNLQSGFDRQSAQSSPTPGMTGPYLLKKETHCTTILDQLLRDDTFSDVTLTAEGHSIKAHKIVLCLASAYFRQVLSKEAAVQSVIVFRDIRFTELKNIINFIYTGEATVDAAELESFMRTAEMLEVTSLCDGQRSIPKNFFARSRDLQPEAERTRASKRAHNAHSPPPTKARKINDHLSRASKSSSSSCVPAQEVAAAAAAAALAAASAPPVIKTEPLPAPDDDMSRGEDEGGEDDPPPPSPGYAQDRIGDPVDKSPPGSRCPFCPSQQQQPQQVFRQQATLTKHLSLCHPEKTVFPCDTCARVFLKKNAFDNHKLECSGRPFPS